MRASLLFLLALASVSSAALAEDVKTGMVREVAAGPRSRAELACDDGKTYVLRGHDEAADDELRRLAGVKVKISGALEPSDRLARPRSPPIRTSAHVS